MIMHSNCSGLDILPWVTTALAVCYGIYITYKAGCCKKKCDKDQCRLNKKVDLDNPKVVHSFDMEDLDGKTVFCRCWKSSKFPYCDGAHNKHNETNGDNVGPLIVQKK